MPAWILLLIEMAIKYFGPFLLNQIKKMLEKKYPQYAAEIEKLISNLQDPFKSDSQSRKEAKSCIGALCTTELQKP